MYKRWICYILLRRTTEVQDQKTTEQEHQPGAISEVQGEDNLKMSERGGAGGAGNPGGAAYADGGWGRNGTGGLLIIYANTFENNNNIESRGNSGASGSWTAGGGSGGGSINVLSENIVRCGNLYVNGGSGGRYAAGGGSGSASIGRIVNGQYTAIDPLLYDN